MKWNKHRPRIYIVPTRYGLLYASLTFCFTLIAADSGGRALVFAVGVLVTLGLMCMYQTQSNLANLEILRIELDAGFSGEAAPLRLRVRNHFAGALISVQVGDHLMNIQPGEGWLDPLFFPLGRRGEIRLRRLKISTVYPFGLFYAWTYWTGEVVACIYPARQKLEAGKSALAIHPDAAPEDFYGHRRAHAGDSPAHLDWKLFARHQQLQAKKFDGSEETPKLFSWEQTPGKNSEEKLSFLATAISDCHAHRVPYGLILPQHQFPVQWSALHTQTCLEALAQFEGRHVSLV